MSFSEWREVKLEECAECIFSGGTPSTKIPEYWNGEFPWLSSGETRNAFIYETEKKITQEGIDNSSTKLAKKDDVVIASAGQGNTRGQTSICKIDTYINQSIISIRSNQKKMDPYYLFYNIYGRYNELRKISDGHSIRGSLTTKIIKDLYIKIPPLQEQKSIAHILSTLDDKIEVNNQINKTLENMAQAIFKQWFVDFEFPNENGEPYKSSGGEMVESELGMIPKGWEVSTLKDVINVIDNRGKTPPQEPRKTIYPIIDVKALSGDIRVIDYNNCMKYVSKETYQNWFRSGHPNQGDILLSTVGSLAELKIFMGDTGCIAQNVVALRAKNISNLYLYELLKNIKNDLVSYNIGSVQPSIKVTHIVKHKILIPNDIIVEKFHLFMDEITNEIFVKHNENALLTSMRDSLLPKLMCGEIRIPLDEEGEAS